MTVANKTIQINTKGHCDIINITAEVAEKVNELDIHDGIVTIFIVGSTGGVTTIEFEPGLLIDYKDMWNRLIPRDIPYQHDRAWGDGNGHSHVRASLLNPSLTIPLINKRLTLGTWQQIVVVDFDNRSRSREIIIQIIGE